MKRPCVGIGRAFAFGGAEGPLEWRAGHDLPVLDAAQGNIRRRFVRDCEGRFQFRRIDEIERHFELVPGVTEAFPAETGIDLSRRGVRPQSIMDHRQNHGSAVMESCSCSGRGQRQIT